MSEKLPTNPADRLAAILQDMRDEGCVWGYPQCCEQIKRWADSVEAELRTLQQQLQIQALNMASMANFTEELKAHLATLQQQREPEFCEFCDAPVPPESSAHLQVCSACWNRANDGSGWMQRALRVESAMRQLAKTWEARAYHSHNAEDLRDCFVDELLTALSAEREPEKGNTR